MYEMHVNGGYRKGGEGRRGLSDVERICGNWKGIWHGMGTTPVRHGSQIHRSPKRSQTTWEPPVTILSVPCTKCNPRALGSLRELLCKAWKTYLFSVSGAKPDIVTPDDIPKEKMRRTGPPDELFPPTYINSGLWNEDQKNASVALSYELRGRVGAGCPLSIFLINLYHPYSNLPPLRIMKAG